MPYPKKAEPPLLFSPAHGFGKAQVAVAYHPKDAINPPIRHHPNHLVGDGGPVFRLIDLDIDAILTHFQGQGAGVIAIA
jgi:hypothetical protein